MSELRKDPVVGRWVIISSERGKRPSDFSEQRIVKKGGFCPFCEGNEHVTPHEIMAYRENGSLPNSPGWSLRVVPNKFPALMIEGDLNKTGEGMFDKMSGIGAHEVIIETSRHNDTFSNMPEKRVEDVFWAFKQRMEDLKRDTRFLYALVFKNEGLDAGASLEHSHSQLIALPIVPKRVKEEIDGAKQYYHYKERCVYCDTIRQEITSGARVIAENADFVAFAPFAPRFPFETWILPKHHSSSFERIEAQEVANLTKIFQTLLRKMDKTLNSPPYNMVLHTAPLRGIDGESYHWHIEIMPKLTKVAGFEWGSGFYINPTPPEEAAKFLREAKI